MSGERAYWPEPGEAAAPSPDGATWPCGHPLTEANSQRIGKSGVRCRICRRRITRHSYANRHQAREG